MKKTVEEVRSFISRERMMPPCSKVLCTVSGGADSVALLLLMQTLGYRCRAVHCNFGLRGDESDRDEAFVTTLCQRRGVELDVVRFDTRSYAATHHLSIEMAAREQRYEAFEQLREKHHLDVIAVAHHAEDSAETLLMNLMRGTGLEGLAGIRPRNGVIVRPLLTLTRSDIEEWLQEQSETWVNDSSNASDDYLRNRIRHHLLPLMEEISPAAMQGLLTTARNLRGAADVWEQKATGEAAETILHAILAPYGYNSTQTSNLLQALRSRRRTLIPTTDDNDDTLLTASLQPYSPDTLQRSANVLNLDVRALDAPLTLRRWQEGDRMCPFGMHGQSKLVSDILTDARLSANERARQQVLLVGDRIAWVVGIRSDERFRVPDDAREIVVIERKNVQQP